MYILQVAKVYEPIVDELPIEFKSVLTEQDIEVIRTGATAFATLANDQSPDWLRTLLSTVSTDFFELQFASWNLSPYRPYFRFQQAGSFAICLPRGLPLRDDMPAFLRDIYSVIGGFRENDFDFAGGLHISHELEPVAETPMWVNPDGLIDPKTAIAFLETFSGSQLCYLTTGGGAWLKACEFHPVDDLEQEVADYFEAILDGARI